MPPSFSVALSAYRDIAAARFRRSRATPSPLSPSSTKCSQAHYERTLFPALSAYLRIATSNYQSFKKHRGTSFFVHPIRRSPPKPLGTSPTLPHGLAADVRRARFLLSLSVARHRDTALRLRSSLPVPALPSALPHDLVQRFHSRFRDVASHALRTVYPTFVAPIVSTLALPARPLGLPAINTSSSPSTTTSTIFPPPCALHVSRCRQAFASSRTLRPQRPSHTSVAMDTAADVRLRYMGKPDELYCRKNSKRFAVWRRRHAAENAASAQRSARAESVMCRSRGHDQLLSHRAYGETSFAPFLFDLDSRAYAFSTKISNAPKLRKAMIDKYDVTSEEVDVDPLQKAHLAAQTNPLFHTRVMNRFA